MICKQRNDCVNPYKPDERTREVAQWLKSTYCFPRALKFCFQFPHGSSQPLARSAFGDTMLPSDPSGITQMCTHTHTYGAIHIHVGGA